MAQNTDKQPTLPLDAAAFQDAARAVGPHIHHTPLLSSRLLSEETGLNVRLKAEVFQRTGSYKVRGPLNKFRHLSEEQRVRGVICSSAGNHAQGVAFAGAMYGIRTVVVMAENATRSKIEATKAYGAEVVLHGSIWDEADAHARELVAAEGFTYIHPFDDFELIAGQGTVGLELYADWPEVDVVVVPIGGGGLISGVTLALKNLNPAVRIVGVESSGAPAMQRSVAAGERVTLDEISCAIDGLKVKRVGERTFEVVRDFVDEVVALDDDTIFDSMLWTWSHCKVVVEGAAAAPVAALRRRAFAVPAGANVVCVLSGGNVDLDAIRGRVWN